MSAAGLHEGGGHTSEAVIALRDRGAVVGSFMAVSPGKITG